MALLLGVCLAVSNQVCAQVTTRSLLEEMTDRTSLAKWPRFPYSSREASSYDRTRISPDKPGWFANNDQNQFIRTESRDGHDEKVMMDADGPGAIVRFWLTTDRNKKGVLRIYLDYATTASITYPAYDLVSGKLAIAPPLLQPHPGYHPDSNGGNTLYLPIPYARHCKVTWEESGQSSRYYQINYRCYDGDTPVKTFQISDLEPLRPLIARVNHHLLYPVRFSSSQPEQLGGPIRPGATLALKLPQGPAAVQSIRLTIPQAQHVAMDLALRSLILKMECDGEPTIWCPVSDFFGSGVGLNRVRNYDSSVDETGIMTSSWVMPYKSSARISIINLGVTAVDFSLQTQTARWQWNDRSMHFHAVWHYESGLQTEPPREWNFVTLSGRGVYVGDTLALFNPLATWYGEGNEKIWIDDETFPSHLGTGTEDYYSFSYAPQPAHQTPFTGEPRIDQPMTQGHNTLIRTRSLDAIPFRRTLKFNFELISWKPMALTYAATTYWYALPGVSCSVKEQPVAATLKIPTLAEAAALTEPHHRQGAIECETMKLVSQNGKFFVGEQDMEPFGADRWSGGKHLLGKAERVEDSITLEWPTMDSVPQHLVLFATQASDFATLSFRVNSEAVAGQFDGYAPDVRPAQFDLGVHTPINGKFILHAQVVGANPLSKGARYYFGLDCVTVAKP